MVPQSSIFMEQPRFGYPVRLLIYLRWIAIFGQIIAVFSSAIVFGDEFPIPLVISIIGLAVIVNLRLTIFTGPRRRISREKVFYYLLYDLAQLGALLFVTGGLNNPFVVLILAPVVIASGFLGHMRGLMVSAIAILLVYILAASPFPLPWEVSGFVLPDRLRGGILLSLIIAILFIGLYTNKIANETNLLSQALKEAELALSQEQKLSSLGALAAAAAHELGSPLTTITLIAKDLQKESDFPHELKEDVQVLLEQAYRCRDILGDLSRNCSGEHVLPHEILPITAAIQVVLDSHSQEKKSRQIVDIICEEDCKGGEPEILLGPEIMHGLGNILQNALQFAQERIDIRVKWSPGELNLSVQDDGPGYPEKILTRIGDPYISGRSSSPEGNTGDVSEEIHLGMGLFIAKTLLAQKGMKVYFENTGLESSQSGNGRGATCRIVWVAPLT